jgi:hypothetical protein
MTTVSKAKKTTKVKTVAKPTEWRQIDSFACEFTSSSGNIIRGEAIESNDKMYEISYNDNGEERKTRVPIAKVTVIASLKIAKPISTEFTEHEPIAAVYRKGKTEIDVKIVATRNDGKLYRIQGPGVGPKGADTLALPIEKVMIVNPEPQQEAAVEPKQWVRGLVPYDQIKGSDTSKAQITGRYSNETERDYRDQMLMGVWDWERPGSEPRLFRDGENYWTGDGHHTAQALTIAHEWLEMADETEPTAATSDELRARWEAKAIVLPTEIPCYVMAGSPHDAKRYSLRTANRFNGMRLSNANKRAAVLDLITDEVMLCDVMLWICEESGKDFDKYSDAIPSDRAIAEYLGNISAPTVAEVWAEAIEQDEQLDEPLWDWLNATARMGRDGKLQKTKAKPEPKAPTPPPQVKELAPEDDTDQIGDDAIDRTGNSVNTSTSTPAPTDNAPVAPGKTYSGEARFVRIKELAESIAADLVKTIAGEMKVKGAATDACKCLADAITVELEVYVLGEEY